jgi:Zn-dependent protease
MRNLLTWSFPLGHLFGIAIRVHVLFPVVALGLILKEVFPPGATADTPRLWLEALTLMGVLFVSVLLHEFGHCYGARLVEGEAREVLLWPLGGLAFVEVPHTPRANFIATAAGPAVNVILCVIAALVLGLFANLRPPFQPWWDPYRPDLKSWRTGLRSGSEHNPGDLEFFAWRKPGQPGQWVSSDSPPGDTPLERVAVPRAEVESKGKDWSLKENAAIKVEASPPLTLTPWQTLAARVFWINYVLFLLNIFLVAYPLDGGRMFQALLWPRLGFRQAMVTTIYVGFVFVLLLLIYAIARDSVLGLCLSGLIFMSSMQQLVLLETGGEESAFGYDFSQGYTSLERDRPPPRRRPNFFQRWKQRRAALRMQREQEQREAEERRMDELLEKVQHQGLQSLTDEERRFLTRVSAKYRNRP